MRRSTFDTQCFYLAEDFLDDEVDMKLLNAAHKERVKDALAGDIQGAIEDFIENLKQEIRDAAVKPTQGKE